MTESFRVPVGLEWGDGARVRWQVSDGLRFTEPFFDDTVRRLRRSQGAEPRWSALEAWLAPPPMLPPITVVFHVSRCGSTLLSRMFAALPANLVISEAAIVDDILRGRRDQPDVTPALRASWLRHAVLAFAASQSVAPGGVFLKLDCWHLFEFETIRSAFPGAPLLFVYRDPVEVLASLMRQPSRTLVRDTVTPEEIGVPRETRDRMSQAEHGAAILGAFFREAATHRRYLVPVPYPSLPAFAWTNLAGAALTRDEIETLRRVAGDDAKNPGQPFTPDAERKRAEATTAIRDACARLAQPAYASFLLGLAEPVPPAV